MQEILNALKAYLRAHQADFVEHLSMCGDTEGGFYDEDIFDMGKLEEQIDKFGEELRAKKR